MPTDANELIWKYFGSNANNTYKPIEFGDPATVIDPNDPNAFNQIRGNAEWEKGVEANTTVAIGDKGYSSGNIENSKFLAMDLLLGKRIIPRALLPYSSTITYNFNSYCFDIADGKIYKSVDDLHTGEALNDTDYWVDTGQTMESYIANITQNTSDIANIKATSQNNNILINGGFDIWETGTSFTNVTTEIRIADVFSSRPSVAGVLNYSRQELDIDAQIQTSGAKYALRIEETNVNASATGIEGVLWGINAISALAGKTLTVSFYVRSLGTPPAGLKFDFVQNFGSGGSSSSFQRIALDDTITTDFQRITATFTVNAIDGKTLGTDPYCFFRLLNSAVASYEIDITNLKLEIGNVATPFIPRYTQTEAQLCRAIIYGSNEEGLEKKQIEITSISNDGEVVYTSGTFDPDDGSARRVLEAGSIDIDTNTLQGDTPYYLFAIANPTNNTTTLHYDVSRDTPTLPSGFTLKQYVGGFTTHSDGGVRVGTFIYGNGWYKFYYNTPVLDFYEVNTSGTDVSGTLTAPIIKKGEVYLRLEVGNTTVSAYPRLTVGTVDRPNILINVRTADTGHDITYGELPMINSNAIYRTWSRSGSADFWQSTRGWLEVL